MKKEYVAIAEREAEMIPKAVASEAAAASVGCRTTHVVADAPREAIVEVGKEQKCDESGRLSSRAFDDRGIRPFLGPRFCVTICPHILNKQKLERVLGYLLDENEFLGPHGIRSLSRYHLEHPFLFHVAGQEYRVQYLPAESSTGMFGGNSNWRGPVWMPVNLLIVRAVINLYTFYGDEFKVECPTGSGRHMTLFEEEIRAK